MRFKTCDLARPCKYQFLQNTQIRLTYMHNTLVKEIKVKDSQTTTHMGLRNFTCLSQLVKCFCYIVFLFHYKLYIKPDSKFFHEINSQLPLLSVRSDQNVLHGSVCSNLGFYKFTKNSRHQPFYIMTLL